MTETLPQRIDAADRPDRALDAAIHAEQCIKSPHVVSAHPAPSGKGRVVRRWTDGGTSWCVAPRYTASIDAALTLVPEGWDFKLDSRRTPTAIIYGKKFSEVYAAEAATPALALCAAALKAYIERTTHD